MIEILYIMLFNYKIILNQIKLGATEKKIKIKIPKAQKKTRE